MCGLNLVRNLYEVIAFFVKAADGLFRSHGGFDRTFGISISLIGNVKGFIIQVLAIAVLLLGQPKFSISIGAHSHFVVYS